MELRRGRRMGKRKVKKIIAYADVGSHGGIFEFITGPVGDRYPNLLQIYSKQITPDLIPVTITELSKKGRSR